MNTSRLPACIAVISLACASITVSFAQVRSPLPDAIALAEALGRIEKGKHDRDANSAASTTARTALLGTNREISDLETALAGRSTVAEREGRQAARALLLEKRKEQESRVGELQATDVGIKDAIKAEHDAALEILRAYANSNGSTAANATDVTSYFDDNPYFVLVRWRERAKSGGGSGPVGAVEEMARNLGNTPVTNLAVGLADFLIDRAKTELNTAFFRRFQEMLEKEEFEDLNLLFPETTKLLKVIGTEIYRYDAFINSLRTAFDNDLRALLEHAPDVLENHEQQIRKVAGLYPALMLALEAAAQLDQGTHPGQVIDQLAFSPWMTGVDSTHTVIANGIQLAAMISESLRNGTGRDRYWATSDELRKLNDETTMKIYLGLLYEWSKTTKYNKIKFALPKDMKGCGDVLLGDSMNVQGFLDQVAKCWGSAASKRAEVTRFITGMSTKVNALEARMKVLREAPENADKIKDLSAGQRRRIMFEAISDVVSGTLDVVEHAYTIEDLPYLEITIPDKAKEVVSVIRSAHRIAAGVNQKQYSSAITELASLLKRIGDREQADSATVSFDDPLIQRLLRYGTFMAALVESETPEQAKAAIEAVALPPGSYSIKRASAFSVSLNGYLGGFAAHEYMDGADNSTVANNFGLTAPVGIALNWGNICRSSKHKWSLGFFFPLIDVGAVASFRFQDTTSATVSTITLADIVSPGMYFEVGIPRTPLTLGFGGQLGSRLREVTAEGNKVGDFYYRTGVTLKVDIPIVHFHASTGKLKVASKSKSMTKDEELKALEKEIEDHERVIKKRKDRIKKLGGTVTTPAPSAPANN